MSRSIIAGIRSAAKGYIDPGMEEFNHQSAEEAAQWELLEKLVESLKNEIAEKILNCAAELTAAADVNAFTDGFRMATELIMETLNSRNAAPRKQIGKLTVENQTLKEAFAKMELAEQARKVIREELERSKMDLLAFDNESLGAAVKCYISGDADTASLSEAAFRAYDIIAKIKVLEFEC